MNVYLNARNTAAANCQKPKDRRSKMISIHVTLGNRTGKLQMSVRIGQLLSLFSHL